MTDPTRTANPAAFPVLAPTGAIVVEQAAGGDTAPLHPDEWPAVRNAVPKRRAEFAGGRACARRALAGLGLPPGAIPQGADRSPVWPRGVVGSITHAGGLCAAAVARARDVAALGIDTELCGAVGSELASLGLRDGERALSPDLAREVGTERLTVVFSAKEAAYKACYPTVGRLLGLHDMRLELLSGHRLRAQPLAAEWPGSAWLTGRYSIAADRVRVCMWRLG